MKELSLVLSFIGWCFWFAIPIGGIIFFMRYVMKAFGPTGNPAMRTMIGLSTTAVVGISIIGPGIVLLNAYQGVEAYNKMLLWTGAILVMCLILTMIFWEPLHRFQKLICG